MRRAQLLAVTVAGLLSALPSSAQTLADPPVSTELGVVDPDYGTTSDSVVSITSRDFSAYEPGGGVTSDDGNGWRFMTAGSNRLFQGSISVPTGVTITRVGLTYCDATATSNFNVNLYDLFANNTSALVTAFTPPDRVGCGLAFSAPLTYQRDTQSGRALMFYLFQSGPAVAGEVKFRSAEVHYRLKVSPAPATATFGDVPTSHPFFQFIEALAASGITGGCQLTPPLYCPDAGLTRGQMAVFLARGLGLHFPN